MGLLERKRSVQGIGGGGTRQEGAVGDAELRGREGPVAARLPRKLSEGPRIPARPFQRRRRLPRHHHQLDHGDAADRAGEMAHRESLLRAAARTSLYRQSGRGGIQALPGRTRAAQGGGVKRTALRAGRILLPSPLRGGVGGGGSRARSRLWAARSATRPRKGGGRTRRANARKPKTDGGSGPAHLPGLHTAR